jgi:hypothetical protein
MLDHCGWSMISIPRCNELQDARGILSGANFNSQFDQAENEASSICVCLSDFVIFCRGHTIVLTSCHDAILL